MVAKKLSFTERRARGKIRKHAVRDENGDLILVFRASTTDGLNAVEDIFKRIGRLGMAGPDRLVQDMADQITRYPLAYVGILSKRQTILDLKTGESIRRRDYLDIPFSMPQAMKILHTNKKNSLPMKHDEAIDMLRHLIDEFGDPLKKK